MTLFFHELSHLILSLIIGFFVWSKWKKFKISFLTALMGGVLVDLDHLFDYFLAFGFTFDFKKFAEGYQFLKSDKIYVPFHAWEWVILLLVICIYIEKSKIIRSIDIKKTVLSLSLAFSLGLYSHLIIDTITNNGVIFEYSLIYRAVNHFDIIKLVSKEHYLIHIIEKKVLIKSGQL